MKTTSLILASLAICFCGSIARAQTVELPPGLVGHGDALQATLHLQEALNGDGKLKLVWTDCWGRTVADETQPIHVDGNSVALKLPLARAVAMLNYLQLELNVGPNTVTFPKTEFVVTPSPVWDDYHIVMVFTWDKPEQQWALRDVGMTAGHIQSSSTLSPDGAKNWWHYDYQYFCDQIAKEFYAAYHTPSQNPKNKLLLDDKAAYRKNPADKQAFFRRPSLSDPQALEAACNKIKKTIAAQMRFKPFFYAHTDEGGVADLVTAWDYDFSPVALEAMRKWLLAQYGSLEAINQEWGTKFQAIEDVVPLTTDEMMARHDDNLSPWADHRFFMNKAFADAVRAGTDAGHSVDKDARLGLEGCQMPAAFGGYDYWLLANAMDCIEPYNIGNNRDIWRALAKDKPAMTTAFGGGDFEAWRLWHQALLGDLGILVYDEKKESVTADAKPGKSALAILPTYKELTGGIVKQLHHATQDDGLVAVHYSQPSITAHWMFEARPGGGGWVGRTSGSERRDSDFLRLRETWTKLLEDGLRPYSFVAYAQLEDSSFDKSAAKVLILPQSVAMSEKECQAVRAFVDRGGTVIADCRTALMDGHCKMLPKGQLDDLFGIERDGTKFAPGPAGLTATADDKSLAVAPLAKVSAAEPGVKPAAGATALFVDSKGTPAVIVNKHGKGTTWYLNAVVTDYHRWRLKPPEGDSLLALVSSIIAKSGVPGVCDLTADGKSVAAVEVFPYSAGALRILAFHRNYQLRSSELGPTEYQKQHDLEKPLALTLKLDKDYAVYDSRAGKYLGKMSTVNFSLDKWQPTILSLLNEPAGALSIDMPPTAAGGDLIDVKLSLAGAALGNTHAFRLIVTGPDGQEIRPLTRTLAAPHGQISCQIPIAVSDPKGQYTVDVHDVATGIHQQQTFVLK